MIFYLILVLIIAALFTCMIYMPGVSYQDTLPPLDDTDYSIVERLKSHVNVLCKNPAGRNYIEKQGLKAAKQYIQEQFHVSDYLVSLQEYQISGDTFANIIAQSTGSTKPDEIIIIGAHYDAVIGSPGANDNGTGVAALLELADLLRNRQFSRTVRFVAFTNEEPPNFMTNNMGSYHYAKGLAEHKEKVIAMFSLETIGYYSNEPGSQHYPPPLGLFYPDKGNFIAFVGNLGSRPLVTSAIQLFREHATFPSEGVAAPSFVPGVGWSDHWSFWKQGYPAIMITDTAPFRYPDYHSARDTPDKVDYEKMIYVLKGMQKVIEGFLDR
jgi:Zn-dependent M28 family amino/carboxypeptidase